MFDCERRHYENRQENIDGKGEPYQIYSFDKYACPEIGCPTVILAGHGRAANKNSVLFEKLKDKVEEEYW